MKPKYKNDPREWRKATLLSALGVAVLSSLLRWRRVLPATPWLVLLALLAAIALAAVLQPRWFYRYYRISAWLGFYLAQALGRVALVLVFFLLLVPLGLTLRLLGKDFLRLRRSPNATSYWVPAKETSPLENLF